MNSWTSPVDIRPDNLAIVQEILRAHLPVGFKVWVFGSRANWTTKDSSDLDLAVEGVASLDHGVMVGLEIAFEESNLPYTVDVVDLNAVSPGFKRIVEDQRVLLPSMATNHLPDKKIVAGRHDTTQGWHQVNLGDIAEIFDGPHATPKKTENGPVFLGISNLVNGRIDISTAEHLSDSDYATWTKRVIPQPGDIVFSYETRLGEAAAIPPGLQCCLGRRMGLLRVSKELVDPQFLLYAYLGPEFQGTLQSRTVQGSTVDRILLTELGTFPIRIPLLPEQRAIAHILGTIDDKIELNRRMSRTLEEMARAIFQDWFVDFGPVRAKLEGQDPYLPPELWDLFPEELVDSELGEIPKGWDVVRIEDVSERVAMGPFGSSIKVSTFVDSGVPIISGQHLNSMLLEDGDYRFITEDHADKLARSNVQNGDIVFTHAGNIGQAAYIPSTSQYDRYVISQRQFYMRCDTSKISPLFVVHFFKAQEGRHQLLANTSSTGVPSIARPVTYLRSIMLCLPPKDLWVVWDKVAGDFYRAVARNNREIIMLATQRDALLPKLLTGELQPEEIEQ